MLTNGTARDHSPDGLSDGAARYLPGISERRGGASTFFHDSLKNTGVQTDSSAGVSATRHYDAWGNVVSSTGAWQSPFGYAGRFGYQGDPTGFKLLGHRYYDPTVGRFLTRDPIKDGRNWYAYCANSPLVHVDPDGLLAFFIPLAAKVVWSGAVGAVIRGGAANIGRSLAGRLGGSIGGGLLGRGSGAPLVLPFPRTDSPVESGNVMPAPEGSLVLPGSGGPYVENRRERKEIEREIDRQGGPKNRDLYERIKEALEGYKRRQGQGGRGLPWPVVKEIISEEIENWNGWN